MRDLLIFVTGLSTPPLIGFDRIRLTFGHFESFAMSDPTKEFAVASTCSFMLRIPVINDYELFKQRMLTSIGVSHFFKQ